jgi:hypothetical protein
MLRKATLAQPAGQRSAVGASAHVSGPNLLTFQVIYQKGKLSAFLAYYALLSAAESQMNLESQVSAPG